MSVFVIIHVILSSGSIMADSDGKGEAGGVEGPDAMYVKLIASDGHEFFIKREHALTSGTIKAMLSGPGVCLSVLLIPTVDWISSLGTMGHFTDR